MATEARAPAVNAMVGESPPADSGPDQADDSKKYWGEWSSTPAPPEELWDTDDRQYLEKVACKAMIRLISVDPKGGSYEVRMKCNWRFRTQNTRDRTDVQLRVPGIRMPGLIVSVNESRIWRDLEKSTDKTIYWHGTSLFTLTGFEIFEVRDFPFDRQIINFELLDFVWRPDKDAAAYDFSMRLVRLEVETVSMLPNWQTYSAIVTPENEATTSRGPSNASRFRMVLRLERKHWYWVKQVFLQTFLITTFTCFGMAMPADLIGKRLGVYATGVLTLMAFRYTIAADLPRVQYSTFTDNYLLWQVVTIIAMGFETLAAYRVVKEWPTSISVFNIVEPVVLALLVIAWLAYFLHTAFFKKRADWNYVFTHQEANPEISDEE